MPTRTRAVKSAATKAKTTTRTKANAAKERAVIVCTSYKGVFFGYAEDTTGDRVSLRRACMAIRWGTTKGVMQLADTGPTTNSKLSSRADIEARGVICVFEVKPEAVTQWEAFAK